MLPRFLELTDSQYISKKYKNLRLAADLSFTISIATMASAQEQGPIIKTKRLLLRPLQQSDAPQIHSIRSYREAMMWTYANPLLYTKRKHRFLSVL